MYIWICIYIWKQSIINIYNSTTLKNMKLVTRGFNVHLNELGRLTFWRFGISKCDQDSLFRITFQCHWTRITETRSIRIDGCQIWKIYIQLLRINSLLLRISNEHTKSVTPQQEYSPNSIKRSDGRSIEIILVEFIQYFQLWLIRNQRMFDNLK